MICSVGWVAAQVEQNAAGELKAGAIGQPGSDSIGGTITGASTPQKLPHRARPLQARLGRPQAGSGVAWRVDSTPSASLAGFDQAGEGRGRRA